jgi:hypothetical protein
MPARKMKPAKPKVSPKRAVSRRSETRKSSELDRMAEAVSVAEEARGPFTGDESDPDWDDETEEDSPNSEIVT